MKQIHYNKREIEQQQYQECLQQLMSVDGWIPPRSSQLGVILRSNFPNIFIFPNPTTKFEKHRILCVSREGHKRNWPTPRYGWAFPSSFHDNLFICIKDLYLEKSCIYSDRNEKSSKFLCAQYTGSLSNQEVKRIIDKVMELTTTRVASLFDSNPSSLMNDW